MNGTAWDLLDEAAARMVAGRTVDAEQVLARAGRRPGGRHTVQPWLTVASGAAAAAVMAVTVSALMRFPGFGGVRYPLTPAAGPSAPGTSAPVVPWWHQYASDAVPLACVASVLLALTLGGLWIVARQVRQVRLPRWAWLARLPRWAWLVRLARWVWWARLARWARRLLLVVLVVSAIAAAAAPYVAAAAFTTWERSPSRVITPYYLWKAGAAPGPVVPAKILGQRMPASPAFSTPGHPSTRAVSLVFRGSVGGRTGLYGVDAANGVVVRLDTLPESSQAALFGDGSQVAVEVAVSPNGRYVAWVPAGDGAGTDKAADAVLVDLAAASAAPVRLPAPPARSLREAGRPSTASTTLAVLDNGTLVEVQDATRALRAVTASGQPLTGAASGLAALGAVKSVTATTGDRIIVWRAEPGGATRTTAGLPFGPNRIDVVRASTGEVLAFAPQVGLDDTSTFFVDPQNTTVVVRAKGYGINSPLYVAGDARELPRNPVPVFAAEVLPSGKGRPQPLVLGGPDGTSSWAISVIPEATQILGAVGMVSADGTPNSAVRVLEARQQPVWTWIGIVPGWCFLLPALALLAAEGVCFRRTRRRGARLPG